MSIKILHLYHDLMNLYGESGNIKVLKRYLNDQRLDVEIDFKGIEDEIDFDKYAFIYVGAGMESNQKLALEHLLGYKEKIIELVNSGTIFLFTGNAMEMLGKRIISKDGKIYKGLGIFDFISTETDQRYTGDVICNFDKLQEPIVGFINRCTTIDNLEKSLFTVSMSFGGTEFSGFEGVKLNNLFGTYLIGPILAKNPHFGEYITKLILKNCGKEEYIDTDYKYAKESYNVTLKNLTGK